MSQLLSLSKISYRICLGIFFFLTVISLSYAERIYQPHSSVEFIAPQDGVHRGKTFWVGFHFKLDPDWHIYWVNPGDSGLQPVIHWDKIPAVNYGSIQWPYPKRINAAGLTSYGYDKDVLLMLPVTVLDDFPESSVTLRGRLDWLVCKIECLPASAAVSLTIPVVSHDQLTGYNDNKLLFDQTQESIPVATASIVKSVQLKGDHLYIDFYSSFDVQELIDIFPLRADVIKHHQPYIVDNRSRAILLNKSTLFPKDLQIFEAVIVYRSSQEVKSALVSVPLNQLPQNMPNEGMSFWLICLFALMGGIILNVMPCVLPVISLKVLSLLKHQNNQRLLLFHALSFTLGILCCFWLLALVLMGLKFIGYQVGWGFQFQSPAFVYLMALFLLALGLNLLGIFEFRVGMAVGQLSDSLVNSFLSGVLVTILATPCTAPFMGVALTVALMLPLYLGLIIFTCLGLGMALPYFLLALFPQWGRFIPKPGSWMQGLKSFFGFVLLACVIWLVWVYLKQQGVDAVVMILSGLWLVGFGLWLIGQQRCLIGGISILIAIGLVFNGSSSTLLQWEDYNQSIVNEYIGQERGVFIDFTAAWCLTCQVNKKTVLNHPDVIKLFKTKNIKTFKADWTLYNDDITKALAVYGRQSVPLYVYYPPGKRQPIVLPVLLTVKEVVSTIKQGE